LFFHPNLLHRSEANLSDNARWSMISCYNRQSNKPYNESSLSCITPLQTISDEAFAEASVANISAQTDFLNKELDVTLK
jgi:phytanoyl-CoA hydroxylase